MACGLYRRPWPLYSLLKPSLTPDTAFSIPSGPSGCCSGVKKVVLGRGVTISLPVVQPTPSTLMCGSK